MWLGSVSSSEVAVSFAEPARSANSLTEPMQTASSARAANAAVLTISIWGMGGDGEAGVGVLVASFSVWVSAGNVMVPVHQSISGLC